ncbi:MAG: pyruvate kinase [Chloroflexota bacterium]|nr:pyruvate kinase [Chloroflexota bacterium]
MPENERPATKIVATVGPASNSERMLRALIEAGVDVFRLNFSHGEAEQHAEVARTIERLSTGLNTPVGVLQDLQGPKIRVAELQDNEPVVLVRGERLTLTSRETPGTSKLITTTYEHLAQDAEAGDRVLLDDGAMELRVLSTSETDAVCEVIRGGVLKPRKGINLPGVKVSAPALTEKDLADLEIGVQMGVDFVALSFVRSPSDVQLAKERLRDLGANTPVVAKLEKPEAIAASDAVLRASDAVMVARGDLGVEMSPESVPMIQKDILDRALTLGLPTITATQMLESMISSPRPTRAEASDVANAILDGSDAVMLSAETAAGQYPVEAVRMMRSIALEAERSGRVRHAPRREHSTPVHALSDAARSLAGDLRNVCAVVPLTSTGYTARLMSGARVPAPIWAYSYTEAVRRQLSLWWGVRSLLMPKLETTEEAIAWVEQDLLDRRYVQPGAMIVVTGGLPLLAPTQTNFIKLHVVGTVA